jgi:hypothetical protein
MTHGEKGYEPVPGPLSLEVWTRHLPPPFPLWVPCFETSIYRFPGSVVQFLWSLSESYFNYGSCIYCFPGSVVSFSDPQWKRRIEVSLHMNTHPTHFSPEDGGSMYLQSISTTAQTPKSIVRISKHYVIMKHVSKNYCKTVASTLKPNFIFWHFLLLNAHMSMVYY